MSENSPFDPQEFGLPENFHELSMDERVNRAMGRIRKYRNANPMMAGRQGDILRESRRGKLNFLIGWLKSLGGGSQE